MAHDKRVNFSVRHFAVLGLAGLSLALPPGSAAAEQAAAEKTRACAQVGSWLAPDSGASSAAEQMLGSLAKRRIVLLGETHSRVEHHRWQLHVLAGLHARRSPLVVGFEMFPRAVQPALDAWSTGGYGEAEFLEASRWREVWGFDPELYLPLFHFVRQNRLPMIALNVDRDLVSRVGQKGWSAVPAEAREGLSDPAPASAAYRSFLAEVYAAKLKQGVGLPSSHSQGEEPQGEDADEGPDLSAILEREDFGRFVEAQLTWDRAMAEALFKASRESPRALVVGVLGSGHIEHGYGVPHQLADLGEADVSILLPVEAGDPCEALEPQVADAVFVLDPGGDRQAEPAKPRLGVMIEQTDDGVRVLDVMASSVAEATGLRPGDVIVSAATFPVKRVAELIEIVQRQAPGTLLPLELKRDGETQRLVAEFPTRFE